MTELVLSVAVVMLSVALLGVCTILWRLRRQAGRFERRIRLSEGQWVRMRTRVSQGTWERWTNLRPFAASVDDVTPEMLIEAQQAAVVVLVTGWSYGPVDLETLIQDVPFEDQSALRDEADRVLESSVLYQPAARGVDGESRSRGVEELRRR
jgi:hypothetical protein